MKVEGAFAFDPLPFAFYPLLLSAWVMGTQMNSSYFLLLTSYFLLLTSMQATFE